MNLCATVLNITIVEKLMTERRKEIYTNKKTKEIQHKSVILCLKILVY